jgi:hypothetical protein
MAEMADGLKMWDVPEELRVTDPILEAPLTRAYNAGRDFERAFLLACGECYLEHRIAFPNLSDGAGEVTARELLDWLRARK